MSPVVCPGEQKCLATGRSACFVVELAFSFANVRKNAYTTSNNLNEVTSRIRESLSDHQRSTQGVDLVPL